MQACDMAFTNHITVQLYFRVPVFWCYYPWKPSSKIINSEELVLENFIIDKIFYV